MAILYTEREAPELVWGMINYFDNYLYRLWGEEQGNGLLIHFYFLEVEHNNSFFLLITSCFTLCYQIYSSFIKRIYS